MYVNDLHNNLPSARDPTKTPNELCGLPTRDPTDYHPFGSVAYVHIPETDRWRKKLAPRAKKMIYLGPDHSAKANRYYDETKGKIYVSSHARFTDRYPHEIKEDDQRTTETEDTSDTEDTSYSTTDQDEPSYQEAINSHEKHLWTETMNEELKSLQDQQTYEEIDISAVPKGTNIVTSKWVLRKKRDQLGNIVKFKARTCARGFTQTKGIDYDETYAPTAHLTSFMILISIAATRNMKTFHFDFDTAFLNGEADHIIHMRPPAGVGTDRTIWRLKKSLYGLKQAGHIWNKLLDQTLKNLGFVSGHADCCMYTKTYDDGVVIMVVHVDDLAGVATTTNLIERLEKELRERFKLKNLGPLSHYNGIRITRSTDRYTMTQGAYTQKMLSQHRMDECNPKATPMEHSKLETAQDEVVEQTRYRAIIGGLLFLAKRTRPDILTATSILSRFNHCPGPTHHAAARQVLAYVKGTSTFGLVFKAPETPPAKFKIITKVDSDYANDLLDRASTTGYIIYLNNHPIVTRSTKQERPALSTTEAEYVAEAEAAKETEWVCHVLDQLQIDYETPIMYADNKGGIRLAQNKSISQRTKHIDVRHHYIRHLVENKRLEIRHISTDENTADFFTKPLKEPTFRKHRSQLCLEATDL